MVAVLLNQTNTESKKKETAKLQVKPCKDMIVLGEKWLDTQLINSQKEPDRQRNPLEESLPKVKRIISIT